MTRPACSASSCRRAGSADRKRGRGGGMVPKARAAVGRRQRGRARRRTSSTGGRLTPLLLEIFTRSGIGTMVDAVTHLHRRRYARSSPCDVRARRGVVPVGRAGTPLPRFSLRPCGDVARPRPSRRRRAVCEAARTLLHTSNLFGTMPGRGGGGDPRQADRRWRAGIFRQQRG